MVQRKKCLKKYNGPIWEESPELVTELASKLADTIGMHANQTSSCSLSLMSTRLERDCFKVLDANLSESAV